MIAPEHAVSLNNIYKILLEISYLIAVAEEQDNTFAAAALRQGRARNSPLRTTTRPGFTTLLRTCAWRTTSTANLTTVRKTDTISFSFTHRIPHRPVRENWWGRAPQALK
jgi:hypothetical protein